MRPNYLEIWNGSFAGTFSTEINITLWNGSAEANTSSWNLIGVTQDATMNETLFADYTNAWPGVKTKFNNTNITAPAYDIGNITAVAWWNVTGSNYITCVKVFAGELCTGYANTTAWNDTKMNMAAQITIPKSSAIWINVNNDTGGHEGMNAFNRSAY